MSTDPPGGETPRPENAVSRSAPALLVLDPELRVTLFNSAAEHLLGWSAAEVLGRPCPLTGPGVSQLGGLLERARAGEEAGLDLSCRRREGLIDLSLWAAPLPAGNSARCGVLLILHDVRAGAEQDLRRREECLRSILEAGKVGTWEWEIGSDVGRYSQEMGPLFGLERGASHPSCGAIVEAIHPDDRECFLHTVTEAIAAEQPFRVEYRTVWPDGTVHWQEGFGRVVRDEAAGPPRVIGACIDVTGRRQAEVALQASERRFRALVENAFDAITLYAADGSLLYASPSAFRLLGRPPGGLAPDSGSDIHPDDAAAVRQLFAHLLSHPAEVFNHQIRLRHGDGSWHWIEASACNLLDDPAVGAVVANWRDVTQRKRVEAESAALDRKVQEAQKLDSLGVLAGGIAHDFNNLLTTILGFASLVRMDLPAGSGQEGHLQQIEQAARQAADLCRQMLAYAGKGRFVVGPVDLNAVVRDSAGLIHSAVSRQAVLTFQLAADLPAVMADTGQMRQVVLSLLTNASEALGERQGVIAIRTRALRADGVLLERLHLGNDLPEGDYVELEVSDTGCGMDEATKARIFEPFFSTKFTGRGLGLAAVRGIVRSHRGAIDVDSTPGQGSTIRVLLPGAAAEAGLPGRERPMEAKREKGLVLVAEDEEGVRTLTGYMLELLGYAVVLAADGNEALARLEERTPAVRLVLLDLTMPHRNGEQTLLELRRRWPDLPVLLMSGYSEAELGPRLAGAADGFLQKPFTLQDLTRHLNAILA
jgi:PAS domain S-box-containing protein